MADMRSNSGAEPSLQDIKNAQAAIAAAKLALLNDVKNKALAKHLKGEDVKQTLALAQAMVAKNAAHLPKVGDITTESYLFGFLKRQWVIVAVLDLAMRREQRKEEKLAHTEKKEDKKKDAAKKEKYGIKQEAHPEEIDAQQHEAKPKHGQPEAREEHEDEFDGPENDDQPEELNPEEVDLKDLKEIAHDAEALKDVDVREWQHELMHDIKDMPSVSDQSAWLFVVSQLDPGNMGFRVQGAAHLMQNVENGLLSVEDQLIAFAGAEALRDPSSSVFDISAPGSIDPGNISGSVDASEFSPNFSDAMPMMPGLSGTIDPQNDVTEEKLFEMAQMHDHKAEAPFSLIAEAGGEVMQNRGLDIADFTHDPKKFLLAQFKANESFTERLDNPEAMQQEQHWEKPVKAKSIFGDLSKGPQPDKAFYDAIYDGNSSSQS